VAQSAADNAVGVADSAPAETVNWSSVPLFRGGVEQRLPLVSTAPSATRFGYAVVVRVPICPVVPVGVAMLSVVAEVTPPIW